jgi:hypothetical protein
MSVARFVSKAETASQRTTGTTNALCATPPTFT